MMDGGLRVLFRKHLPHFDWCSIESGFTTSGIPDSNYCINGIEGWVEHKKTSAWSVTLRPEQCGWILRRVRNGGRVTVAVRQQQTVGPRTVACDRIWLIPGHGVVLVKTHGLKANIDGIQSWDGGPSRWDWKEIQQYLTK